MHTCVLHICRRDGFESLVGAKSLRPERVDQVHSLTRPDGLRAVNRKRVANTRGAQEDFFPWRVLRFPQRDRTHAVLFTAKSSWPSNRSHLRSRGDGPERVRCGSSPSASGGASVLSQMQHSKTGEEGTQRDEREGRRIRKQRVAKRCHAAVELLPLAQGFLVISWGDRIAVLRSCSQVAIVNHPRRLPGRWREHRSDETAARDCGRSIEEERRGAFKFDGRKYSSFAIGCLLRFERVDVHAMRKSQARDSCCWAACFTM